MEIDERVIVIGASAGGVEALLRLASRLPADFPAPILIVLHIGAYRSLLPELLEASGPLRAVHAVDGATPRAGEIHVAPPDRHLLLEHGRLRLYRGPKEQHARPAINPLFRSAALDAGVRVVGVVLTGCLDDGAAGLQAIRACGGTTVVQDPHDAVESSMPRSALSMGKVDHVWRLDDMADELERLARPVPATRAVDAPEWLRVEHAISMGHGSLEKIGTIGAPSGFTCPDCGGALFELTEGEPLRFLCHTGHAFGLRSLAAMHDQSTDGALWAALRALQEKEAILRRLATTQADEGTTEGMKAGLETRTEADRLERFIADLRRLIGTAPPDTVET